MNGAGPGTVPSAEARRKTATALTRREVACQVAGGVGAAASCAGMIVSLVAGFLGSVGASGGNLATQGGMSGMGAIPGPVQPRAAHPLLAVLNHIAVPLLLVSVILMLAGVAQAGRRPLAWVAAGSAFLLIAMVPTSPQVAVWLLAGGFVLVVIGYVAAWNAIRIRRGISART